MPRSVDNMLPVASVSEGRLQFPGSAALQRAWQLGIFYLEVPKALRLEGARQFGRSLLSEDSPFRQIPRYGELEGFINLNNNQQTKLALRRHHWDHYYPAEIAAFGRQLDTLGIAILCEVLRQSGIPERHWQQASGGYSSGGGTAFLNFVHYDTRRANLGLHPHTDYGFVTILDATTPGLQIELEGTFVDVPVLPGHFVVNFGEALSFITQHSGSAVGAVVHRVLRQRCEHSVRHGIVYFANPNLEGMLWQFDTHGTVMGSSSVAGLFALLEQRLTE